MPVPSIKPLRFPSADSLSRTQDGLAPTVSALAAVPLNNGQRLSGVKLSLGLNYVAHGLSRAPLGWLVTRIHGAFDSPAVSKPLDYAAGAAPVSGSFTSYGGDLLFSMSASCFTANAGNLITVTFKLDPSGANTTIGTLKLYMNEANSHKAFPSRLAKLSGVASGSHSVQASISGTGASSDANDFFDCSVQEIAPSIYDAQDANTNSAQTLVLYCGGTAKVDLWVF